MAAGYADGTTILVNIVTKKEIFQVANIDLPNHVTITDPNSAIVNSVTFSPDGTTLAIGDIDGTIALVNMVTRSVIAPA